LRGILDSLSEWSMTLKRWQFWLGVAISVICLAIVLPGVEFYKAWSALKTADYWWILPGVAVYFVAVWARTWRWHYLLRPLKPVPLRALFPVVAIGYMGNNIYPARAGEILRAYVLKRREGVSVSASLATILVERIFDGLVMLLFVFFTLPQLKVLPDLVRWVATLGTIAFVGALTVFLALAAVPQRFATVYTWLISRFVPSRFRAPLTGFLDRFVEGLSSLRSGRDILMIFATSLFVWLMELVKYWLVMHAFSFRVSFFALMLMNGVVNLMTTLPSPPGYIGTFEFGIEVLKAFKVDGSLAASYTVVLHAALWLPITLVGAWYFMREGLRWSDFRQAEQLEPAQ
jgi:uncharacterized protein (TIRG00374 family)